MLTNYTFKHKKIKNTVPREKKTIEFYKHIRLAGNIDT